MERKGIQTCALNITELIIDQTWTTSASLHLLVQILQSKRANGCCTALCNILAFSEHTNSRSVLHVSLTLSRIHRSTPQCVGCWPLLSSLALVLWTPSGAQSTGRNSNCYTATRESCTMHRPPPSLLSCHVSLSSGRLFRW